MNEIKKAKVNITGLTNEGCGVAKVDGKVIFIPNTAKGDEVSVSYKDTGKNYAYGDVIKLLKPSPNRIECECPCYKECGGCTFRHIKYEAELEAKKGFVADALKRIGGIDIKVDGIMSDRQERYRNKAQYPISADGKAGFFTARSHNIIPCGDCALQPKVFSQIALALEVWIKQFGVSVYNEKTGKGLLRHLYIRSTYSGEILVVLVINGVNLPHWQAFSDVLKLLLCEKYKGLLLNINREKTNVILGKECKTLYGDGYITDVLCGVSLRVSPLSFAQVNHSMAEKIYRKAVEYADPKGKTVIDLYCGTGAIGLIMAGSAKKVYGVEIVPKAIEDAKVNAEENGIKNIEFLCDDAARAAKKLKDRGVKADTVVLDPPRKGCEESLLLIVANDFCPERIVYVSCNASTLARDCKILSSLGYKTVKATPADLFPRTPHVETVALLVRTVSAI